MDVLTPEMLEVAINSVNSGGFQNMDMYTAFQFLWQCAQEKYPELAGGVLQVIGGSTVLFRGMAWLKGGENGSGLLNLLGKVALNK